MGYDDRREIFERLEALERLVRSRHDDRGSGGHDQRGPRDGERRDHRGHERDRGRGDNDFDEKRIIDTIVGLVSEQVGRIVEDHQARSQRNGVGGDEKRIVDLIVKCVSEHVQEIVSTELDRRFGRPDPAHAGEERAPRGGSPEPEQS